MKYYLVAYDVRSNSSYYFDVRTDCFMRSIQSASPLATANTGMYHLNRLLTCLIFHDSKVLNKYRLMLYADVICERNLIYCIGAE